MVVVAVVLVMVVADSGWTDARWLQVSRVVQAADKRVAACSASMTPGRTVVSRCVRRTAL